MPLAGWKKVLLVDLGFLGDTAHSIPALRALALEGRQVDVMTTAVGAELLRLVPEVGRIWVVPLRKPSPAPWKSLGLILALRREKYDAAITFSGAERNLFCTALSGAKEKIASIRRARWWNSLLPFTQKLSPPPRDQPLFQQRLTILQALGWAGKNPGWSWRFPDNLKKSIVPTRGRPQVYLSVSAFGSPLKEWPLGHWSEMMKKVWEKRPEVRFMIGHAPNGRERKRAHELAGLAKNPPALCVLDSTVGIAELALVLKQSDLFAGLDSGVLHLASALGLSTVSVFRDYVGKNEWMPLGSQHRVLLNTCVCDQKGKNLCGENSECLAAIQPELTARALLELLHPSG